MPRHLWPSLEQPDWGSGVHESILKNGLVGSLQSVSSHLFFICFFLLYLGLSVFYDSILYVIALLGITLLFSVCISIYSNISLITRNSSPIYTTSHVV